MRALPRLAALLFTVICCASAQAQFNATWLLPQNGDWTEASKWSTDPDFPNNGGGKTFNVFIDPVGGPYTIALNQDITIDDFSMLSVDATLNMQSGNTLSVLNYHHTEGMLQSDGTVGTVNVQGNAVFDGPGNKLLEGIGKFNTSGSLIFNFLGGLDICDTDIVHGGSQAQWQDGTISMMAGATFENGAASTFTISGDDSIINGGGSTPTFTNKGTLVKNGGGGQTLVDQIDFDNQGTLTVQTGTLSTTGNITNIQAGTLTGGTWQVLAGSSLDLQSQTIQTNQADVEVSGAGSTFGALDSIQTNGATGKLKLDTDATFQTQGDFTNDGELTIGDATTLKVNPGSSLTNYNAGTGTLTGGVFNLVGTAGNPARVEFDNADIKILDTTVTLDGPESEFRDAVGAQDGMRNLDTVGPAGDVTLVNGRGFTTLGAMAVDGRLAVNAGSTFATGAGQNATVTGTLAVGSNSTFTVGTGGALTNYNGGNNTLTGGTIELAGTAGNPARLEVDGIDVQTLAGSVKLDGQTAQIVDPVSGQDGMRNLAVINGAGALTIAGDKQFTTLSDFEVQSTGVLQVDTGAMFRVGPGNVLKNLVGGTFTDGNFKIQGTLQFDAADIQTIQGSLTLDNPASKIIDENGLDAFRNLSLINPAGSFTIKNGRDQTLLGGLGMKGGLRIGPAGPNADDSVLTLNGDLDQTEGTLTLDGGVVEFTTGQYNLLGGTLAGNGVIDGDVVVDGVISPGESAGAITIEQDLQFNPGAALAIEIGGLIPGAEFDQVNILGAMLCEGEKAGVLAVSVLAGYSPQVGDSFDVALYGSRSGEFANYKGLELPGGLYFEVGYNSDRLTLTVVPAPGTVAVGFLAVLGLRKRRPAA